MRQRLGCLTPVGLTAALLTALILAGAWLVQGGQIFSPGALNAVSGPPVGGVSSHAEIAKGRANDCGACHAPFWQQGGGMSARCLDCHTPVADEIRALDGLHGHLAEGVAVLDCRECHTEHHGQQAVLTLVDADFPHQRTGFELTAHQTMADGTPFACRDCHVESYAAMPASLCAGCHADLDSGYIAGHLDVFGPDCLACHDGLDSYGADFDHASTDFPLTGRHAPVDCAGCHQGMTTLTALQGTPVDCVACHLLDDEHAGTLGPDCAKCHSAEGWTPATFDHGQSAFPLTGAHISVPCADCHTGAVFAATPTECAACHAEPLSHAGQFGTDCVVCHSTSAWQPAGYDGPHTFPMDHGDAAGCRDCHPAAFTEWTCYTCHDQAEVEEDHRDEGIADFANCMECHADGEEHD